MRQHAHVVIGANFGDEGKGLLTDYLTSRDDADVVVRFNGGAQAGHTVVTPDGQRHVFSHFGAGSLAGAKTFFGPRFVVNPLLFFKESDVIQTQLKVKPSVMADPRCYISTPYDMLINQAVEERRGTLRHGSCGVGFGETIERCENKISVLETASNLFSLNVGHLSEDNEFLHYKLQLIRRVWVPNRLKQLNVTYTKDQKDLVMNDTVMWNYMRQLEAFKKDVTLARIADIEPFFKLVFEGAQGLGLDQVQGEFPHVTRSFTGLANVVELCNEAEITNLTVHYVTRAYLTRHGAGDLPNELKEKPYRGIKEQTNVTNQFQGAFRYANLDVDDLRDRIRTDLQHLGDKFKVMPILAVTCLDQIDDVGRYYLNGKLKRVPRIDFARTLARDVGLPYVIESNGPTRNDLRAYLAL